MTPRQIDADAWRLVCVLTVGSWLAVDLSPLGWPVDWWLYIALGMFAVHQWLAGRDKPRL